MGGCIVVNRRVMVVDNELSVCAFLSDLLLDEGYEPVVWHSGAGAYAAAKRIKPAAMLLDMNMETPDAGLLVAETMCRDRETQNIAIIIVSAEHDFLHAKYARLQQLPCRVHPETRRHPRTVVTPTRVAPRPCIASLTHGTITSREKCRGHLLCSPGPPVPAQPVICMTQNHRTPKVEESKSTCYKNVNDVHNTIPMK